MLKCAVLISSHIFFRCRFRFFYGTKKSDANLRLSDPTPLHDWQRWSSNSHTHCFSKLYRIVFCMKQPINFVFYSHFQIKHMCIAIFIAIAFTISQASAAEPILRFHCPDRMRDLMMNSCSYLSKALQEKQMIKLPPGLVRQSRIEREIRNETNIVGEDYYVEFLENESKCTEIKLFKLIDSVKSISNMYW